MITISRFFGVLLIPIVLGYFIPFQSYYGLQNPYPYMNQGYGRIPSSYFPFQSRASNPYDGFPIDSFIDVSTNDAILDDEMLSRIVWPNFLKKNLFKKLSALDVTFNKEREDPNVVRCRERFNGTLVNNECYKYVKSELPFSEARMFCQRDGGDIWTPDTKDAFLFYKLAYLMPEFGKSTDDDIVFGATVDSTGVKVTTINGVDITNTLLLNIDDGIALGANGCMTLGFDFGSFYTYSQNCALADEFMCEYPLSEASSAMHLVFNKLAHIKNKFKIGKN